MNRKNQWVVLLMLLFTGTAGLAQSETNKNPDSWSMNVPEKWAKESAVILYNKMEIAMTSGYLSYYKEQILRRVKILDKASLSDFSEFFYVETEIPSYAYSWSDALRTKVSIRITKPNGEFRTVSMKDAVSVRAGNSARDAETINPGGMAYKKIAVPGLEVGDVIEYDYSYPAGISNRLYFLGSSKYPTIKQVIKITTSGENYFHYIVRNNAPKFTEEDDNQYLLVDTMREKTEEETWAFRMRSIPYVRFSITSQKEPNYPLTLNKKSEKLDNFHSDITSRIALYKSSFASAVTGYLNKYHKKVTDPVELATTAYYAFRHEISKAIEAKTIGKDGITDEAFTNTLLKVFKSKKIKAKIVTVAYRGVGHPDDYFTPYDMGMGVAVQNGKDTAYFFNFSEHSTCDFIPAHFEGGNGYLFSFVKSKPNDCALISLKDSRAEIHLSSSTLEVDLNLASGITTVNRTNTFTGAYKEDHTSEVYDYINAVKTDRQKMFPDYKEKVQTGKSPVFLAQQKLDEKQRSVKQKEQLNLLENNADNDFDIEAFKSFELLNDGRYKDNSQLRYKEVFTARNLIAPAGSQVIFEVGRLIGVQVEIKGKELNRKYDVHLSNARTIKNQITINIPAGYRVVDIKSLNFNVDNPSGSFISTAKVEGNKLIITTTKVYKKNYEKKENWKDMVSFLDAAYDFSQRKIILEKL